jgi:hypothetical protein
MRDAFKIISATPVEIPQGGTALVRLSAPPGNFSDRFKLELDNATSGISLGRVSAAANGLELVFASDASNAIPRFCWQFMFRLLAT